MAHSEVMPGVLEASSSGVSRPVRRKCAVVFSNVKIPPSHVPANIRLSKLFSFMEKVSNFKLYIFGFKMLRGFCCGNFSRTPKFPIIMKLTSSADFFFVGGALLIRLGRVGQGDAVVTAEGENILWLNKIINLQCPVCT